jgi:hypothetical protein
VDARAELRVVSEKLSLISDAQQMHSSVVGLCNFEMDRFLAIIS